MPLPSLSLSCPFDSELASNVARRWRRSGANDIGWRFRPSTDFDLVPRVATCLAWKQIINVYNGLGVLPRQNLGQ